MEEQSLVLTVEEAGRLLGLSRNSAYKAAKAGDIPTIRIGRLLRVPRAAFDAMLRNCHAPGKLCAVVRGISDTEG